MDEVAQVPVITRIARQKKDNDRYSVYVDDGNGEAFAFGVHEDVLLRYQLRKGLELHNDTIQAITHEDEISKTLNQCLSFLTYRMRSEKEIRDYMKRKNVAESVIAIVIDRLKSRQYLNDLEFAKSYVRDKKHLQSKGSRLLAKELREKGIAAKDIEEALKEYSSEEQLANAIRFALKKQKQLQKESNTMVKQKITQQLRQKGFEDHIVETALNELPAKTEEEEWEAIALYANKAHNRYHKYSGYEYEQRMKQYLYRKGFPFPLIERFLHVQKEDGKEAYNWKNDSAK